MEYTVGGIPVHYAEEGGGMPVVALHGWFVDHRLMSGILEPLFRERPGYRRIYPDLPGMGRTLAPEAVQSSDDLLDAVLGLIDGVVGEEEFLLVGLSHGGYLARAVANRRAERVAGLALICPLGSEVMGPEPDVPEHVVLRSSGDLFGILDPELEEQLPGYLVVQTPETLRRFQENEGPGLALADMTALERIQENWALREEPEGEIPFEEPALIVTGRQDSVVGYSAAWGWLGHYPRATLAVLDRAGHGLPHEQPGLLYALMAEWLERVREHRSDEAAGTTD